MKSPLPALTTAFLTLLACGASAFAGLTDRTLDIMAKIAGNNFGRA